MKIRVLTSASQDLIDGYRFYEKQSEGLGSYFLDSLYPDIDALANYGGIHPIYFNNRALSKRFPFAIYYRIESNTVLVYAILDCRRSPAWLRNKIK